MILMTIIRTLLLFGEVTPFMCSCVGSQVTDHNGSVASCTRPGDQEASGAVLSATLILYGTGRSHGAAHGMRVTHSLSFEQVHTEDGGYWRDTCSEQQHPPRVG